MAFQHGVLERENGAVDIGQRIQPDCAATRPVNACHRMSYSMSGGKDVCGEMAKMNKALKPETDMWSGKPQVEVDEGKRCGRVGNALHSNREPKGLEQHMAPVWAIHDGSVASQIPMTTSVRNVNAGVAQAPFAGEKASIKYRDNSVVDVDPRAEQLLLDHGQAYQLLSQTLQKSGSFQSQMS
ncbi:hypothetical protein CDD82_2230 [Ophiocordyceps australis]|uniref:Uncharacterized protein n=1 Tax=Ophiocordyceps australis TaxID=1399860 RepID=A0A2C5ZIU8_9HYPO|nr:hypothetical protein CDD82_2230 [Ophiocordyceps australis]